jgi:hypothetical protein
MSVVALKLMKAEWIVDRDLLALKQSENHSPLEQPDRCSSRGRPSRGILGGGVLRPSRAVLPSDER